MPGDDPKVYPLTMEEVKASYDFIYTYEGGFKYYLTGIYTDTGVIMHWKDAEGRDLRTYHFMDPTLSYNYFCIKGDPKKYYLKF